MSERAEPVPHGQSPLMPSRRRAGRITAFGLPLVASLLLPVAAHAATPALTANFHTIGIYWYRTQNAAGVAIQYRPAGATAWKSAQSLWFDSLSGLAKYRNQYRGSIVNLRPGTLYNVRYSLDGGASWKSMPDVATRAETFPGSTVTYSGTLTAKLVITSGGTASAWKIYDGQGSTVIDPGHISDCVQVKASYVVVRGFRMRDCKYNGIFVENRNVVIENNTIEDWGIQEIDPNNPSPRLGEVSKKKLGDPASTCIDGTDKADIGRYADSGIKVVTAANDGIVIQRNTIRNPRYRSTRWQECPGYGEHPYGPQAIRIDATDSNFGKGNVIRYNNIYATNTTAGGVTLSGHSNRYYDIISAGRQQDLDVYGNIVRNGTDDAIEIDDAAVNVRIFGNYVDYALTTISHQHMEAGPSYIFRNIFDRGADNDIGNIGTYNVGVQGGYTSDSPLKFRQNNGGIAGFNGPAYVYHNTTLRTEEDGFNFGYSIFWESRGRDKGEYRNVISKNNIFMAARNYMYDTSPKNWLNSVFSDMYNRGHNMNYDYSFAGGLLLTAVWKDGHGPSPAWTVPPEVPTGLYEATNAGIGVRLPNFNDAGSMDRGAQPYDPDKDVPMRFGTDANWTYVPAD